MYHRDEKTGELSTKRRGLTLDWKNLYFPIGCGMVKGGVLPNVPVVQRPDGSFTVSNKHINENAFDLQTVEQLSVLAGRIE